MHNDNSNRHVITLGLVLALLLALWLRLPFIGAGMPYFYDEDEAHHFNRTVEMVKKGEFNPNYFHKPSLHFYLRMPVVAVAFLWTVRNGQIRSVQDIQTRDPYGLGGYAFTASHPGIVKWNRALSVAFSLGLVLLAFLITKELLACEGAALLAALGTAVSPELIENAAVIGVDMPMALLCLLAVYLALKLYRSFSVKLLVLTGLVCGLAVSAKYNALPIMFLPLLVLLLLRRFAFTELLLAITVPVLGFLVGSPFTLLSLPLFLDQFAYEIWHYGVSGHEGHSAEPGWPQALFYLKWLSWSGIGLGACALSVFGVLALLARDFKKALLFLFFPCAFILLMISQKANFTRNLLVFIPFCGVFCGAGAALISGLPRRSVFLRNLLLLILAAVVLAQPTVGAFLVRIRSTLAQDSRQAAFDWLRGEQKTGVETAISGRLWMPSFSATTGGIRHIALKGVAEIDPAEKLIDSYLKGFDRVVLGPERKVDAIESGFVTLEQKFKGEKEFKRVVKDPEIKVYRFVPGPQLEQAATARVDSLSAVNTLVLLNGSTSVQESKTENYFWLDRRLVKINIGNIDELRKFANRTGDVSLKLDLMTPWSGQELTLSLPDWSYKWEVKPDEIGSWISVDVKVPYRKLLSAGGITAAITQVRSPATQGLSTDSRRLGLAVRSLRRGSHP